MTTETNITPAPATAVQEAIAFRTRSLEADRRDAISRHAILERTLHSLDQDIAEIDQKLDALRDAGQAIDLAADPKVIDTFEQLEKLLPLQPPIAAPIAVVALVSGALTLIARDRSGTELIARNQNGGAWPARSTAFPLQLLAVVR